MVNPLTPSNGGTRHCYLLGVHLDWSSPVSISHHRPTRSSPEAGSLPARRHKHDSVTKNGFILYIMAHAAEYVFTLIYIYTVNISYTMFMFFLGQ